VAAINGWRFVFWAAVGAIGIAALTPTPYLPPQVFDIWDKAQHAGAFLLLGGLGLLAYPASALRVLLGLLVFGGGIELAQAATGWRIGDWIDWLADVIGVGAAYLAWVFWKPARSYGQMHSWRLFKSLCMQRIRKHVSALTSS